MTKKAISITLPDEFVSELDMISTTEHRSRSEIIREAVQNFLRRRRQVPVVDANARELKGIDRGREEINRGEYVTLQDLTNS
ncbi:MAG: ribbon-helix-helix protein, CopG family [Gammaproteobacteria bacterium]|nr:ribbon-helix-helix protein, CopG family [Gammaproteobacteria bacterium]